MPAWITINKMSGKGNATITIAPLGYNTSGSTRGVIVVARNLRTGARAILQVNQEPLPDNSLLDSEGYVLLDSEGCILLSNE